MPRDIDNNIITAKIYAERLASLETALADAQQEYAGAAVASETGHGDEADVRNARANIQSIRDSIESLTMAREVSKTVEAKAAKAHAAAEHREAVATAKAKPDQIMAAALSIQSAFNAFLGTVAEYEKLLPEFEDLLLPLIDERRERSVRDVLSRRFEGTLLVGLMQAAGVPGLSDLEELTPIGAMRAFGGKNLVQHVGDRLGRVMALAAPDLKDEIEEE